MIVHDMIGLRHGTCVECGGALVVLQWNSAWCWLVKAMIRMQICWGYRSRERILMEVRYTVGKKTVQMLVTLVKIILLSLNKNS